jgi:hypothetical protein
MPEQFMSSNPPLRRLNSEVQQASRRMINLQWSFVSMPFAWSRVQLVGDPIALFLGQPFECTADMRGK